MVFGWLSACLMTSVLGPSWRRETKKLKRSRLGWITLCVLVAGLGIYALAPGVMAVVLPYALLAACPISMLLMMKSMHGEQGTPHESGDAPTPEVRLARLKAQHAALDEKIGALERDESQQTYRERRARKP